MLNIGFDKTMIIGKAFNFKKKKKVFYCDIEIISDKFSDQILDGNMSIYPSINYTYNNKKGVTYIKDGLIEEMAIGNNNHADYKLTGNVKQKLEIQKKKLRGKNGKKN